MVEVFTNALPIPLSYTRSQRIQHTNLIQISCEVDQFPATSFIASSDIRSFLTSTYKKIVAQDIGQCLVLLILVCFRERAVSRFGTQQPKIPEETGFVSEVVEVLPAESVVLFRSESLRPHSLIIFYMIQLRHSIPVER